MSAEIVNKFLGMLGLAEGEEEYIEEEVENTVEEEVEEVYERPVRAGYFGRSRATSIREEAAPQRTAKVLPMASATAQSKMVITQPTCFEDVQEIGEYLKQKRTVIVNLESVNKEDHRRIIDFVSGASFVTDGSIQKVSSLIYLITPKTVEIQNDIERAQYRSKMNFSWMK